MHHTALSGRNSRSCSVCLRALTFWPAVCVCLLAFFGATALAFDVEPAQPTRCDELVLVVTRSFANDCGWSATAQIQQKASIINVALELHSSGDICLPVALEHTFRVPVGSFSSGTYTLSVSWNDLDQPPEEKTITIADATCPEKPLRGDANRDHDVDLADALFLLFHLFAGGAAPSCMAAADADADGALGVADAIFVLDFLFRSGPVPTKLSNAEADGCRVPEPFTLSSAAFADGAVIPVRHTCDGVSISPPLAWSGAPAGTRSFALTCLDPDAPSQTYVHWIAWDILSANASLAEGAKPPVEGTNSSSKIGYAGPCPPRGAGCHRYFFTLYALDVDTLALPTTTRRTTLETALEGHIFGTAVLMGRYSRS